MLTPSQTKRPWFQLEADGERGEMDLTTLFMGFHPDDVFGGVFSVDMSELLIVFGTIAVSLGIMVWFGSWWSR